MTPQSLTRLAAAVLAALLVAGACGDDDGEDRIPQTGEPTTAAPTTAEDGQGGSGGGGDAGEQVDGGSGGALEILVTNDDGYQGDGLDVLVEALRLEDDVELTVVAPATDVTGTSDRTTPGTLTASEQTDTVNNLNVPTCTLGQVRGLVEVPSATTGDPLAAGNCMSRLANPTDDIVGFRNGFAVIAQVPPEAPTS